MMSNNPGSIRSLDGVVPLRKPSRWASSTSWRCFGQHLPLLIVAGMLEMDVNLKTIASTTAGFTGADLENLVNEAALQAARLGQDTVFMRDFEYAKDKVLMGKERRSLILSDEEKRITAYHEGGHALVAKLLPGTDPVHKVTIIPRGVRSV